MFSLLIQGIFLGLTVAILVGPAFFTLIQTSIVRGFKSGIFLAIGVFLSDAFLVTLCFLGASQILSNGNNKVFFGIIGGLILISFGIVTFTRKPKDFINNEESEINKPRPLTYILKGFFLNLANPTIIIFWMGIVGGVIASAEHEKLYEEFTVFFSGTLFTIFFSDVFKCFVADKIKNYLTPKVLLIINHTIGGILILFGLGLILKTVLNIKF